MTALLRQLTHGIYAERNVWILVTYGLILLAAGLVIMLVGPMTAMLNSMSAWWQMVAVLVEVGVHIVVPDEHRSVGYVFGDTLNNTGFPGHNFCDLVFIYAFLIGLLMAQYSLMGFDASAHTSEETQQASRGAAWGIVMSVVVSVI